MSEKILEIAAFNIDSAIAAEQGGANRIELCINQEEGGTSPPFLLVKEVLSQVSIPVNVMVRPRSGDFIYTPAELDQMKAEITLLKSLPINGLVFGLLTKQLEVDLIHCKELLALSAPLPCTFHRAFDLCPRPIVALEEIIHCGFSHLLCSGNTGPAAEGLTTLKKLIEQACDRMVIMPGGGIRSGNLLPLLHATGAREVHSSALKNGNIADIQEIQQLKKILNTCQE